MISSDKMILIKLNITFQDDRRHARSIGQKERGMKESTKNRAVSILQAHSNSNE